MDNLARVQELLGLLSQNLTDAKAGFRACKAYRSHSEGWQFNARLLHTVATQLQSQGDELAKLTAELSGRPHPTHPTQSGASTQDVADATAATNHHNS